MSTPSCISLSVHDPPGHREYETDQSMSTPSRISPSVHDPPGHRGYETDQSVLTPARISPSVHDQPDRHRTISGYETNQSISTPSCISPSVHDPLGRRSISEYETDILQFAENIDSHSPAPSSHEFSTTSESSGKPLFVRIQKISA